MEAWEPGESAEFGADFVPVGEHAAKLAAEEAAEEVDGEEAGEEDETWSARAANAARALPFASKAWAARRCAAVTAGPVGASGAGGEIWCCCSCCCCCLSHFDCTSDQCSACARALSLSAAARSFTEGPARPGAKAEDPMPRGEPS